MRSLGLALLVVGLGFPARAQVDFETYRMIPVLERGWGATGVVAADFDGDGILDLAVTARLAGTLDRHLRLLRGTGDGGFETAAVTWAWARPLPPVAADFDGDGHLDLAYGDRTREDVIVRLGDGTFGFPRLRLLTSAGTHSDLAVADFNRDGILDIVVANEFAPRTSVFLGTGNAFFAPPLHLEVGGGQNGVATGDLDGDGNTDIALSLADRALVVFWGDGLGAFSEQLRLGGGAGARTWRNVKSGDIDGDGRLDLVVAHDGPAEIGVLYSDGPARSFTIQRMPAGSGPRRIALSDLDDDGLLDVAVYSLTASTLEVHGNRGQRHFAPRQPIGPFDMNVADLIASDVQGDGRPDLLAVTGGSNCRRPGVLVFPGEGRGAPLAPVPSPGFDSGASDIASGLSVGDFDGDGHVDVVIAYQRTPAGPASVHRGDGRGGFTLAGTPDVPFSSYWTRVRMGDLDGDGLSDLVFRTTRPNEPSRVVARVSRGDGTFALSHVADVGPVVGSSEPRGLDLADVDGDGHLDVVTYHADRISVLLGAGDGSFSAAIESTGGAGEVALGDWNEDGFLDVASAGGNVLLGNGSGGLVLSGFVGGRVAEQIAPADHDGDGHLDLVTLEFGTRVIRWARGDGTGAFERHVVLGDFISPEYTVVDLAVRDLDEDGFLDAVIAVDEPGAALVLRGDGQGGFEAEGHFGLTSGCQGLELLEIADGDGDGHADLLSVMLYPAGAPGSSILFARNRSLDAVDCRAGNVNGGAGPVADVLFVNESAGAGTSRTVTVGIGDPLLIRLDGPPSRPSPLLTSYVLYGSLGEKVLSDVETLPQGVGRICLRTPLTGGVVDVTWNTIGRASLLGPATIASLRAPAVLYDGPAAAPRPLELLLQGILIDPGSPSGLAAVTNAVHLAIQ